MKKKGSLASILPIESLNGHMDSNIGILSEWHDVAKITDYFTLTIKKNAENFT